MGILIPTQTLTGPQNPLMGAATGLLQGLGEGIPISEQLQRNREESQRRQAVLQMEQQKQQRTFASEDAGKKAAQALLEFSMGRYGNAGAATQGSGSPSPSGAPAGSAAPALPSVGQAEEQGPGVAGKPLQGPPEMDAQGRPTPYGFGAHGPQPGALGDPTSFHARLSRLHDTLVNAGASMEQIEKVTAAAHRDESLEVVGQHQARLNDTIQRGLDKGAYDAVDEDGHPDPSATIEMQNIQQRIQSLDRTDPKAAAALLDQAEQAEAAARQYKAHAEMGFANRQRKIAGAQAELDQVGSQGPPTEHDQTRAQEMQGALSMYQNHVIDDKQFAQVWQDARQGTYGYKQKLAQAEAEKNLAQAELARARAEQGPRPQPFGSTEQGMRLKSQLDTERGITLEKNKRAQQFAPQHPRNPAEAMEATQAIEDQLKQDFPNHGKTGGLFGLGHVETPEEEKDYEDTRAAYFENAKIKDPRAPQKQNGLPPGTKIQQLPPARIGSEGKKPNASQFLDMIHSGQFKTEDELQAALKKAGLTEDDIHAAAGGK